MNTKKILVGSLVVFILFQLLDFVVHGLILADTYESLEGVWREDMMDKMWIMYITGAIFSVLFTYIFARGYENKGLMEGARYGFIMGLFMMVVGMFNQYAVYPIPLGLTIQWFIYGMIEFVIVGAVLAMVYKPKAAE